MRTYISLASVVAVCAGLSAAATTGQAATVVQSLSFGTDLTADVEVDNSLTNDCAGYFGSGFLNCTIGITGVTDTAYPDGLSPVIAKYEKGDGGEVDPGSESDPNINTVDFPTVSGSEFQIDESNGSWTYTPGVGDPSVLFWVLKQENGFMLYWEVDEADTVGVDAACETTLSLSCLLAAVSLTSGSWAGDFADFSHITWYDTGPSVVPLPAGFVLFLSGLAGIGFLGRYKAKRREPELM